MLEINPQISMCKNLKEYYFPINEFGDPYSIYRGSRNIDRYK
jgi:hypothetical protein